MSDVEVPNIIFATETSLTVGPGHDDITGTAGNDLVFGASGGPLTTFGPADIIRGGSGGMDMLSITYTTDSPQAVGWLSRDMDVFQARAFNSGEAYTNMIDALGTSVLWLDQNTGDTEFEFIQNLLDLVATGGDFNTDIKYAFGVAAGPNQDQEILVEGANADIDIDGGVPNLWLQANGPAPSILDVESDATNVMLKGDGSSLDLDLHDGAYVATYDSSTFGGHTTVDAGIGNGGGLATFTTGNRKDEVHLWGDGESDALISLGKAADKAWVDDLDDVEILLGGGKNFAEIGGEEGVGDVTVKGGKAADDVEVYGSGHLDAGLGQGFNILDIDMGGNADVSTGKNGDTVFGDVGGHATFNLRAGTNDVDLDFVGGNTTITTKGNDDDIRVFDARGAVMVNLGNAKSSNFAHLDNRNANDNDIFGHHLTVNGGAAIDNVVLRGENDIIANLFEGSDSVDLSGGNDVEWDELNLSLGEDNDFANLGSNHLYWNDQIKGEGGIDTITATSLSYLASTSNGGAFAGSDAEIVQTSSHWGGAFYGDLTGANAAGVMTYNLMGNINTSTFMRQMADDVNLNFWDNGGTQYFEIDSVVDGGTANLKFTLSGSSTYNNFRSYDVGTLNVEGVDNIPGVGFPVLTLGSGTSFVADEDLTTVNLTGSAEIHMGNVQAENLAMIDGSSMSRNIELGLTDVADAVNAEDPSITVQTGSGADKVWRGDTSANFDIETNGGNDSVYAGGGNDNVKLGAGDDWVEFEALDLDDFDTVDGGDNSDTLRITSGALVEDDDIFFGISSVETWIMATSPFSDSLSLGNIAQTSGLERIYLNGVGSTPGFGTFSSGNDAITLDDSFTADLEVTLGYGPGSDDTVDAGASGAELTVRARSYDLFDGGDVITGGTGLLDEVEIYDVNTYNTELMGISAVEYVTITTLDTSDIGIYLDGDNNVAAGETLTISTRTDWSSQGDLDVFGSGELDGMLVVTGGWGNDRIFAGEMGDTVTTNQGNDYVEANGGNDTVSSGSGNDTVYGGDGNDSIDGGTENDFLYGEDGADVINAGDGADWVFGGAGADVIDVGVNGDVDTLYYSDQSDSFGGSVDQVSSFVAGVGGDKIDVSDVAYTGDGIPPSLDVQQFVGNAASFGQAQGLVTENDGIVDVVFQADDQVLWVDVNDDGTLNNNDLQIHLIGVTGLENSVPGLSANLVMDTTL